MLLQASVANNRHSYEEFNTLKIIHLSKKLLIVGSLPGPAGSFRAKLSTEINIPPCINCLDKILKAFSHRNQSALAQLSAKCNPDQDPRLAVTLRTLEFRNVKCDRLRLVTTWLLSEMDVCGVFPSALFWCKIAILAVIFIFYAGDCVVCVRRAVPSRPRATRRWVPLISAPLHRANGQSVQLNMRARR